MYWENIYGRCWRQGSPLLQKPNPCFSPSSSKTFFSSSLMEAIRVLICEAVDLPVHFGVVVVFCPLFGQSWLRCPNNLHLKHLPSFMRRVRSSIDKRSMSMALGSFFSGKENFFCAGSALGVVAVCCLVSWKGIAPFGVQRKNLWPLYTTPQASSEGVRIGWSGFAGPRCYEQLLFFFSSSLTCDCLMLFLLLILTRVYLQEYTSYQTHVQHVFASW
jgi:hypothetical protein